jgi:hypothetical protein
MQRLIDVLVAAKSPSDDYLGIHFPPLDLLAEPPDKSALTIPCLCASFLPVG